MTETKVKMAGNHRVRRIVIGSALILAGVVYKRWLAAAGLALIFSDAENRHSLGSVWKSASSLIKRKRQEALQAPASAEVH
jgi:hypothetical protein